MTVKNPSLLDELDILSYPDYKASWQRKLAWYQAKRYLENENLFVTFDDERGSLDAYWVQETAQIIKALI